jgi:hypothetical protein
MDHDILRGRGKARGWSEVRSLWLAVAVIALVLVGLGALRLRSGSDTRHLVLPATQIAPGPTTSVVTSAHHRASPNHTSSPRPSCHGRR